MVNRLQGLLLFEDLTNNNYKENLVKMIDIDVRYTIDLKEGAFSTLDIIKKKIQKQTKENR